MGIPGSFVSSLPSTLAGLPNLRGGFSELLALLITQDTRILGIHFASGSGISPGQFLIHRLKGYDEISLGFYYEVWLLSGNAYASLKSLQALPVEITILLPDGGTRRICGLITEVHGEGSDGSLASYRIVVEPAPAILRLNISTRIFLQKTDLEIALILLKEGIQRSSVFASSFTMENRCRRSYPVRDFVFQCGEDTWRFLRRRLARAGISFVFVPGRGSSPEHPQHTLIFFDDPLDLDENEAKYARFHRADGTEEDDSITDWQASRTLQVGQVTRRSWDHRSGSLSTTSEKLLSDQGPFGNALASMLEDYRHEAPLEHDDLQGHEWLTLRRAQQWEQRTKAFHGSGTVRAFQAGTFFTLKDHPAHDRDKPGDRKFLLTRVELEAENNFGGLKAGHEATQVYRNRFECQRSSIPVVPKEMEAPIPGPQTATVVCVSGKELHTCAPGSVKVCFHGCRKEDHPEAGVTGTDRDSAWIRLLQPWSSQGMGGSFVPRAGDEVLVQFLGNDPDKPVIAGVLPGERRPPARFSGASSLPGDHALSGLRSRMLGGSQGSELVFDDTPDELRARLASDHAKSELNLGHIVDPRRDGRAMARGEGVELRTDGAAAVRGQKGLLLSAEPSGVQMGRTLALGNLEGALALSSTLSQTVAQHGAGIMDIQPQKQLFGAFGDWEKGSPTARREAGRGQQPLLLASAPAGLGLSTQEAATIQAGTSLDLVSQDQVQISAGKRLLAMALESLSLFAHKLGMKLIAAGGDITIQAQNGNLEMNAHKRARLSSSSDVVELAAQIAVRLMAGGGCFQLKGGDAQLTLPGTLTLKVGKFQLIESPESVSVSLPQFPSSEAGRSGGSSGFSS